MRTVIPDIKTRNKPVVIIFEFILTGMSPVFFTATAGPVLYFNREYIPETPGKQRVELTLPVSAWSTDITMRSAGSYSISSITTWDMKKLPFADADAQDFMTLAEKFAQQFKTARHGKYYSPSGKYVFNYVPVIRDEEGRPVPTPMQVDHVTGEVAIDSDRIKHYTVQSFVAAALHENTHYRYDTKDEIACDLNASKTAVDRGYMHTEILNAFTSVLDDMPDSMRRTDAVYNFLKQYNPILYERS